MNILFVGKDRFLVVIFLLFTFTVLLFISSIYWHFLYWFLLLVTEFHLSWSLLSIKVNTNGVVSFLVAVSQFTPDPFPLGDQRRLISPFWGDVDTRNGGVVSYRESTDTALLQRATKDIRRAFVRHQKFTATWIFIATWDRVAFYGASGLMRNKVWIRDKWGVRCFRSYLSE